MDVIRGVMTEKVKQVRDENSTLKVYLNFGRKDLLESDLERVRVFVMAGQMSSRKEVKKQ